MDTCGEFPQATDQSGSSHEQRKIIKYNHLVANLLAFHTVVTMTRALSQAAQDGHVIDREALASMNPYRTGHYNRWLM